jgi:dihydrofolate reductase
MSKVIAIMSMSLDGFVADLNDGVSAVFNWYFHSRDVEFRGGGADPMTFRVSGPSAEHLGGLWAELGAVLTGRRTFDKVEGWGGNHAWGPAFVLTHNIPAPALVISKEPRPSLSFRRSPAPVLVISKERQRLRNLLPPQARFLPSVEMTGRVAVEMTGGVAVEMIKYYQFLFR